MCINLTGTNSDVAFLVGPDQERVLAHRQYLAHRSPVFQSMFFGDLAENSKEIQLPDADVEGFRNLLRYLDIFLRIPVLQNINILILRFTDHILYFIPALYIVMRF